MASKIHNNKTLEPVELSWDSFLGDFETSYHVVPPKTINSLDDLDLNEFPLLPLSVWTAEESTNTTTPRAGSGSELGSAAGVVTISDEMIFNEVNEMSIIVYSILCAIATVGNLTVFLTLWRCHRRRTRVSLFIMNLAFADLTVATIMMPIEIGWHATVSWEAGDLSCRVLMFFRAFGIYLSSFVLIAISLDRYFAVARPLSLQTADRRGRVMLTAAWIFSVIASLPQSVIFHIEKHPDFPWFSQCVTFGFFPSTSHELAYNIFNLVAVYLLPLTVIVISYALILRVISRRAKENLGVEEMLLSNRCHGPHGRRQRRQGSGFSLRSTRSDIIQQAKSRTLKMTIVIVSVFIVCWTPYFVMSAWWWIDKSSASEIPAKTQKGLFLFAVSNCCVDPIVYGMFSTALRRAMHRRWQRLRSIWQPSTTNFAR